MNGAANMDTRYASVGTRRLAALALIGLLGAATGLAASKTCADEKKPSLAVKADTLYVGDGRAIEHGVILIQDGRIAAIGPDVTIPDGVPVVELAGGTVTPGLIDANALIEPSNRIATSRRPSDAAQQSTSTEPGQAPPVEVASGDHDEETHERMHVDIERPEGRPDDPDSRGHVGDDHDDFGPTDDLAVGVGPNTIVEEQGSEVVPYIRVLDSVNFHSPNFQRLVRGGVTTVYVSPDSSAVIGARGAVVRTAGPEDQRVLTAAAAVKAVIGSDPSSMNRTPYRTSVDLYVRRPNSRMGLVWVFRKAFYDAMRRQRGVAAYGADTSSPEASAVLQEVLSGNVPLRIQARIQQDILAALRLAEEFHLRFTLEEATEAYLCLDELKAKSIPVVFGPIYERPSGQRSRMMEGRRSRFHTFRSLLEAGIDTALSAQEFREEDGLARQAMYAMRFGVDFDDALRSVTQTPARLLGLDSQLGTLEVGKRADLVVWSGQPFAATSRPAVVVVEGQVVVDAR